MRKRTLLGTEKTEVESLREFLRKSYNKNIATVVETFGPERLYIVSNLAEIILAIAAHQQAILTLLANAPKPKQRLPRLRCNFHHHE